MHGVFSIQELTGSPMAAEVEGITGMVYLGGEMGGDDTVEVGYEIFADYSWLESGSCMD